MKKILLIVQREYITRVRKTSFIITTLLAPVGFALFFLAVIFLADYGESKKRIAVIDESGYFKNKFADDQSLYFLFVDTPLAYMELNYQALNYDGIIYIPQLKNLSNPRGIQYRSDKQLGIKPKQYIEGQLKKVLRNEKIEQASINKDVLKELEDVKVNLTSIIYGEQGEKTGNTAVATVLGYMMGFIIYMVLFVYGTMVMKGVMEEKTSRIVEVIASSVRPFQLMLGKVIGIGAVGLTQFILWAVLILITNLILGIVFSSSIAEMSQFASNPELAPSADQVQIAMAMENIDQIDFKAIFLYFIFYFLGGYLLYGSLFAAIGSATNDEGDVQSFTFFVSLPIIVSIFIMMSVVQEPDSALAVWSSIIPFTSPIVMPARIPFEPDTWQIVLSMISLIAGFLFTSWLAAKIYRTGILMYGKKVTVKELARWVMYKA